MSLSGFYYFSIGYYFTEGNEANGIFLELPHGHDYKQRTRVAKDHNIEWDYCAFLYTDDNKRYFTNFKSDKDVSMGVNKAMSETIEFDFINKKIIGREKVQILE